MADTAQLDVLEKRITALESLVFGNADKDALYPKVITFCCLIFYFYPIVVAFEFVLYYSDIVSGSSCSTSTEVDLQTRFV